MMYERSVKWEGKLLWIARSDEQGFSKVVKYKIQPVNGDK